VHRDLLPDRILAGPDLVRKTLGSHGRSRVGILVARIEHPPAPHGNAEGLEIVGGHVARCDPAIAPGRLVIGTGDDRGSEYRERHAMRHLERQRRARDARQRGDALEHSGVHRMRRGPDLLPFLIRLRVLLR